MSIRPTQPQSVGGVLDTTSRLVKASVLRMIPLSLLMAIAGSPASIYVFMQGGADPNDLFAIFRVMSSPGYLLASFASSIGMVFAAAAASMKMAAIASDADVNTVTALQNALMHLPSLVVSLILYVVAVSIGPLLLIMPALRSGVSAITVTLGVVLTLAAVIPGVSLLLFVVTNVFENKGPIGALVASHRLVWGNWWRTNAILAVGVVVLFVIYMIVSLLVGMVTALLAFNAGTGAFASIELVSDLLVDVLASPVIMPFGIALFLALYWDLKLRKQGES